MNIKHSKYKNSGILFELLVRQITSDLIEGKKSPIQDLLKKYFVKTELGKEYKLYESLLKNISVTESKANIVLNTLLESAKTLNKGLIKKQKYNLISEIKKHYDINEFFNHKLPHYKIQAAFYTLLESQSHDKQCSTEQIVNNKVTILEYLTAASIDKQPIKNDAMDEFIKSDKDTKILTYKLMMEKFNTKYNNLDNSQKLVLKELINSIDNKPKLKEFYSEKITEIKNSLIKLNRDTTDESTQIKINEVISLLNPPSKNQTIKDNDLIDLLQYYSLIKELKQTNVPA